MKKTIITNVLTNEQYIYRNNSTIFENLAACILYIEKYNSLITSEIIQKTVEKYNLKQVDSKKNDRVCANCIEHNLIAYQLK